MNKFENRFWRSEVVTDGPLPALAESSIDTETLWLLAENIPTLCWIANGDGYIAWYNRRWHDYCGSTPKVMARGWESVCDPASLPDVKTRWQGAIISGVPFEMTFPLRGADGIVRPFLTRVQPVRDETGAVVRWFGVNIEMSAQVQAEHALEQERDLSRAVIDALPGVVYAKDRDGRMLAANQGTAALIGKPPSFFLGKTDVEYLDDKDQAEALMATDRRIMEAGVAEQVEEAVSLPDGTQAIWLSTKAPWRSASGETIGLIGASVDITARKAAEAELERINVTLTERIAAAVVDRETALTQVYEMQRLEAISQLTGGIAHDFNNLLTPIVGTLDLLNRKYQEDPRAARMISGAQESAERARVLVSQLLSFARRQILVPKSIDLAHLVRDMTELIIRSAAGVDVRIEIADDLPCVRVDPNQLELALLNLAINARDAMPNGGVLTIFADVQQVSPGGALQAGDYVALHVTDNGCGMTAETLARAAEPFYTTKRTGTGTGTGLGLSMVDGLARQTGGMLTIDSSPGLGTTAHLWLPSEPRAVAAQPSPLVQATGRTEGKALTILLVDDEPLVRMGTADMLETMGHNVIEASSGFEALEVLSTYEDIDVLLTDYMMPGMTGSQLIERVRDARPEFPVALITGFAKLSETEAEKLPRLTKPFRLADLEKLLDDISGFSKRP